MGTPLFAIETRGSLLQRLRDPGNTDSWELFAKVYGPPIIRYCRRFGLQEADATDVAQDVLAQVAVSIRGFEYDPAAGRFRDWLGTVIRGKLDRHWRKRTPVALGGSWPAAIAGADEAAWAIELDAQLLRSALEFIRDDFEDRTWRAFELTWLESHSAPDAARRLGMPVAHVYVARSRVLKRLQEELQRLCDDVPRFARPE